MIFKTTLKAGQTNVLNKTGRHFYLLTAADEVAVRFRDSKYHSVDFESPLREGMSADFAVGIDEITLTTKTAQYIEFWLGDTKLDYSKIAAGGASATVDSGRAVCELGHSLAIPADFRRKSINIQALTDVTIGGLGVDAGTGYAMKAGEVLKLNTRGDIYSYLAPARIDVLSATVSFTQVPAWDADGWGSTDGIGYFIVDRETGNYIAGGNQVTWFSTDKGVNWTYSNGYLSIANDTTYFAGQTKKSVYILAKNHGRLLVSNDGGAYFEQVCTLDGGIDKQGLSIVEPYCYGAWVGQDEKNIIIVGYYFVWESFDGGASWEKVAPANLPPSITAYTILKTGGRLFCNGRGELWEAINGAWISKGGSRGGVGQESIIGIGSNIYWFCSDNKKLYYSPDLGDTVQLIETVNPIYKAFGLIQVGESIVLNGLNYLGVIKKPSDTIDWYQAETANPIIYESSFAAFDGESIVSRARANGVNESPSATVWPLSLKSGAIAPAPLQWLAELN